MQLSRRSFVVVVALAAFALVACGPSAQQVKTAREAQYRADGNVVFRAVVDAIADKRHKIAQADASTGAVATEPRWYEPDGTFEDKAADGERAMVEHGSILLGFEVQVTPAGDTFTVTVTPRAVQVREGSAAPHPLSANDPAMTSWIAGKTDDLYLAIYERLKPYAVKPGA